MEQELYFMPLGGGQRVGASCYYLRIGGVNLILDAGTGIERGLVFEPICIPSLPSPSYRAWRRSTRYTSPTPMQTMWAIC